MRRDRHQIIIQTSDDPNYEDGGDSAFTTGMYAFAGSETDRTIMSLFIVEGKLVRHPFQPKWNDSNETSRDQVKAFFAALPQIKSTDMQYLDYQKLAKSCLYYAKSWRVNKDILMPADKFYLYSCLPSVNAPFWLYPLAYINQAFNILVDCYISPNHEMNQSIVTNTAFGKGWLKFLYKNHPDLCKNVTNYYSGWRDKKQIGIALNEKILETIK